MSNTIPFTKEKVKEHIDDCIRYWRNKKEHADTETEKLIATCYVDAFQSVRSSLFGELLPY